MTTATIIEVQDATAPPDDVLADPVSTPTAPTPADDPELRDRWRVSLHEAGHLVVSVVFRLRGGSAFIWRTGGGVAGEAAIDGRVRMFRDCVMLAAGKLAERIAWTEAIPTLQLKRLEVSSPDETAELDSMIHRTKPTDDASRIADWCVQRPLDWRDYRRRSVSIRWRARQCVNENRGLIISVARALYEHGQVNLRGSLDDCY